MGIMRMLSKMLSALSNLCTAVCIRFYGALFLEPFRKPVLLRVRASRFRRGAGMLEYALLALIAIAVAAALRTQLLSIFEKLTDKISDSL